MKFLANFFVVPTVFLAVAVGRADAQTEEVITKLPEVESVPLRTKDFVALQCSFYPGGVVEGKDKKFTRKPGKEVVPVILLHGWEGQRGDYDALASFLQKQGHAVVVPDLRGHGTSTSRRFPNGTDREIDPDRMRSADFNAMVVDVEAVKKFLLEKNNAGELNIEMLCIVGADLGAIVAVNYAALDWARPQLSFQKQGRDVKALVLLSPQQAFKGATLSRSLLSPAVKQILSVMVIVGIEDKDSYSDAKAIHNRLERFHQSFDPKKDDPKEIAKKQDLFLMELDKVKLKGTSLVHPRAKLYIVFQYVSTFIQWRLVNKKELFPWKERRNPLDEATE